MSCSDDDAEYAEALGAMIGAVGAMHVWIAPLLAECHDGCGDAAGAAAVESLDSGIKLGEIAYTWPQPPFELQHIYREAQHWKRVSVERWSLLRQGFELRGAGNDGAAQPFFDAADKLARKQDRATQALTLMLWFLERDRPDLLVTLALSDAAQYLFYLGEEKLGNPSPRSAPPAPSDRRRGFVLDEAPVPHYSWLVRPVPDGRSRPSEKSRSLLLTTLAGSEAERLCHQLTLSPVRWDRYGQEVNEFRSILLRSHARLVEPRNGGMDLLSTLASLILDRVVDLSATDTQGLTSGGPASEHLYPTIYVEMTVPRADNQWYLLSVPERGVLLQVLKEGLNWSEFHVSSSRSGDGLHADELLAMWSALNLVDPMDVWDLSPGLFDEIARELREIAAERDDALTGWKNKVSLKVSSSRDMV